MLPGYCDDHAGIEMAAGPFCPMCAYIQAFKDGQDNWRRRVEDATRIEAEQSHAAPPSAPPAPARYAPKVGDRAIDRHGAAYVVTAIIKGAEYPIKVYELDENLTSAVQDGLLTYERDATPDEMRAAGLTAIDKRTVAGSIEAGYYDVEFTEIEQAVDADGNVVQERVVQVRWPGARVLMMDGEDAIVEHYPVGRRDVTRRIDRVTPAHEAKFTKVDLPGGA